MFPMVSGISVIELLDKMRVVSLVQFPISQGSLSISFDDASKTVSFFKFP